MEHYGTVSDVNTGVASWKLTLTRLWYGCCARRRVTWLWLFSQQILAKSGKKRHIVARWTRCVFSWSMAWRLGTSHIIAHLMLSPFGLARCPMKPWWFMTWLTPIELGPASWGAQFDSAVSIGIKFPYSERDKHSSICTWAYLLIMKKTARNTKSKIV